MDCSELKLLPLTLSLDFCSADQHACKDLFLQSIGHGSFSLECFQWRCCLFCCQLLMIPMVMSVLYVWAQINKDTIVTFWFGTRFKVAPVFSPTTFTSHLTQSHLKHEIIICSQYKPGLDIVIFTCTFFKAHYLPWVILGFNFIIQGS